MVRANWKPPGGVFKPVRDLPESLGIARHRQARNTATFMATSRDKQTSEEPETAWLAHSGARSALNNVGVILIVYHRRKRICANFALCFIAFGMGGAAVSGTALWGR